MPYSSVLLRAVLTPNDTSAGGVCDGGRKKCSLRCCSLAFGSLLHAHFVRFCTAFGLLYARFARFCGVPFRTKASAGRVQKAEGRTKGRVAPVPERSVPERAAGERSPEQPFAEVAQGSGDLGADGVEREVERL